MVISVPPKVPHAIERALQRYGLKLTVADLRLIAFKCFDGYGRLKYMPNDTEKHLISYMGKNLVVIYKPHFGTTNLASPFQSPGTILTILPPGSAYAGDERSPATKFKAMRGNKPKLPKKRRQHVGH